MTQEQLKQLLFDLSGEPANTPKVYYTLDLINQHVSEVIGGDDKPSGRFASYDRQAQIARNELRAEQRQRANLVDYGEDSYLQTR